MNEFFATFRWWLVLLGLGAAVTPLCWSVFHQLPSRGYPYAKMLGLLLTSYLFWLMGSYGFLSNTTGGILFALLLVVALSGWALIRMKRRHDTAWREILREQWRTMLITELLFVVLFLAWAWMRSQNPSIRATEKLMEFAFLNASANSEAFPPLDPWLSGFSISYYYFGYVMTSVLTRLAAVPTAIGFNLSIAWLSAGAGIGAFGVVHDLVGLIGASRRDAIVRVPAQWMLGLGIVAALAVSTAGNLTVIFEMAHANDIGSAQFWEWLDVRDLNDAPNSDSEAIPRYQTSEWWWWRSSRVIHEYHLDGREEAGLTPIAEFPAFSYILGDMHPHVLALPFAFLSMAVALCWYLRLTNERLREQTALLTRLKALVSDPPFLLLTALVVGGMSFLNTWDVIIYLFLIVGAFALAQWRDRRRWSWDIALNCIGLTGILVIGFYLLYLPFYLGFSSQAGAPYILPMMMRPTRFPHFFIIFGMPLTVIMTLMVTLIIQQKGRNALSGAITFLATLGILTTLMLLMGIVVGVGDGGRLASLATDLGVNIERSSGFGWATSTIFDLLPIIMEKRLAVPFTTLILAGLIGACVMVSGDLFQTYKHDRDDDQAFSTRTSAIPFVLLLVMTAALLTIGPEFVYLRDNFGQRLNTIFKFYYQAWAMFGVAAPVGLYILWNRAKIAGAITTILYGLMFVGAMTFPFYAAQSRAIEYRGGDLTRPATLDGLAYVRPDERAAIDWLAQQSGPIVLVEAIKGAYDDSARISASTGHQTLLGWENHERQWRGENFTQSGRRTEIETIYRSTDWAEVTPILDRYAVDYVYVGHIEQAEYGGVGLEKFVQQMPVAYQNSTVTIYAWQ